MRDNTYTKLLGKVKPNPMTEKEWDKELKQIFDDIKKQEEAEGFTQIGGSYVQ